LVRADDLSRLNAAFLPECFRQCHLFVTFQAAVSSQVSSG
jgi:hypothetical protein